MLLATDIGNTQTVLGVYDNEQLIAHWRIATLHTDTADELAIRIQSLFKLENIDLGLIDDVAIASVVPPLSAQWVKAAKRISKNTVLLLDSNTDTGLTINYQNPSEIGADRLADAVAALKLYGAPCIVVDFGTATNIEVLDKNGAFIGGIIAPGVLTSADALFNAAARLAKFDIDVPAKVIGTTTKTAVQSGLTFGEIDRIDGLIKRIFDELGYPATVVATGGLSSRVVALSSTINITNDDLTLEGLKLIHKRVYG